MNIFEWVKRPVLKSFLLAVLLMFFIAGCSSGGGGGGQPTETIKMNGTASIPSSISSSKSGILNKLLPGTVALENAVVNAKSLTTGFSHPALAPVSGGSFSIEVPKVSDYYLVTALKGNILMMKLVFIDAGAGSPIDIGEIDSASTSVVLMTERFFEEILRRERVELHSDLPGDLDPTLLSQLLNIALIDVREKELELRNLVESTIDETGAVDENANLDDIFTTEGEVDTDNIASINIYITIQEIIIQLGDFENDEDPLGIVRRWINGGTVDITADTIINFFGDISIVNNTVTPEDLQAHLNIISKPETTITEKWEDASTTQVLENPTTSTSATFFFNSSRSGSTFKCRLNNGAFVGCSSPINYFELESGPHTFCVEATDIDEIIDPSPACFTWTVDSGAQLVSIAVTPANPSLVVGETQQFTATGTFTDSNTRDLTNSVTWSAGSVVAPDLLVGTNGPSKILRFDETSGAFKNDFTTEGSGGLSGPLGLTIGPDGHLYASSRFSGAVIRYNGTTGEFIDIFVLAGSGGLSVPHGLVFGPDGNLYIVSNGNGAVRRYNGTTGAFMDVFASGGLSGPTALIFGPDGNLYVSSSAGNSVLRYNGTTGASLGVFASGGGLSNAEGLAFGPNGNLYVGSYNTSSILQYNGTTGAFMAVFASGGGLINPVGVVFGPDGNLYAGGSASDNVVRYNGSTGAFIDAFIPSGSGGLNGHHYFVFKSQFSSSEASIDANGLATGVLEGSATITATESGTGIAGSTTLTITTDLNAGLVAYYPFNGNANDGSGNGNDGTVNGATLTTDRFGNADSAYSFDGNDSIDVPDDPMFTFGSDPFTISSWVRLSSLGGYYLMGHDEGGGDRRKWIFWLGTEGISIIIGPGGGWNPIGATTPFETNRWYHVAIRREADVFTAFVDGLSIGSISKTITIQDPNTTFQIGTAEPENPQRTFRGSIDEVRIYDRALSDSEVSKLASQKGTPLGGMTQTFEDGTLEGWVVGGRQITGGFGSGTWGVSKYAGSQMAYLTHISFTELNLSKTFEYSSGDILQFDAEFSINGNTSPSASGGSNFYSMVSYALSLYNATGNNLGGASYRAATSTFPYGSGAIEFTPNGLEHYAHDISQLAFDLGVDINDVATFGLTFNGYSSWWSGHNMTIRFDNVDVSP